MAHTLTSHLQDQVMMAESNRISVLLVLETMYVLQIMTQAIPVQVVHRSLDR